jgi:hypothetical protein
MYYRYDAVPVELEPELWGLEVWSAGVLPAAAGSLAELADVLDKYLYSAGLQILEPIQITAQRYSVFLGPRMRAT